MKVYHYSNATGEYMGEGEADVSPLWTPDHPAHEQYLHPAFTTTEPPPAAREGFARVLSAGRWLYVADHRGTNAWPSDAVDNSSPVVIDKLGSPESMGLTLKEPPKPKLSKRIARAIKGE